MSLHSKWLCVILSVLAPFLLSDNCIGSCVIGSLIGGSGVLASVIDNSKEGNVESAFRAMELLEEVSASHLLSALSVAAVPFHHCVYVPNPNQ